MEKNNAEKLTADVCIVGGGPAGMVLALFLAQRGIRVLVLESHKDFEREYRGEVLMPRFIQMMQQIGLADYLETYPHLKLKNFELFLKDKLLVSLSLSDLCRDAPYALWMPQPILLNAFLDKAKSFSNFEIRFGVTVRDLLQDNGIVTGVIAEEKGEKFEIRSKVTVGADGRSSIVRKAGAFEFEYEHHDFDVIWFTIKQPLHYENTVRVFFSSHHRYLILPKYPDCIQCGLLVPKGEFSHVRSQGIEAIRRELLEAHPVMRDFADSLKDFSPFNVLQARVSYVKKWAREGCLLIGDAAHTCSPAGAIGVAVAVATALVSADVLIKAFQEKNFSEETLSEVQRRRAQDVKTIQRWQGRFTQLALFRYPYLQGLSAATMFFAVKTGILRSVQRKIAVMKKPLPIDSRLHF